MKTIVIYASKKGATREVAEKIKERLESADVRNISQIKEIQLGDYETVIIGSSVYAGGINKEIKTLAKKNIALLMQKRLGLFLCGLQPQEADKVFNANFPAEIVKHANAKDILGGIYDPAKSGAIARYLMKKVAKLTEYTNTIDDTKINEFANPFMRKGD